MAAGPVPRGLQPAEKIPWQDERLFYTPGAVASGRLSEHRSTLVLAGIGEKKKNVCAEPSKPVRATTKSRIEGSGNG
jgi:hypothetical protein